MEQWSVLEPEIGFFGIEWSDDDDDFDCGGTFKHFFDIDRKASFADVTIRVRYVFLCSTIMCVYLTDK